MAVELGASEPISLAIRVILVLGLFAGSWAVTYDTVLPEAGMNQLICIIRKRADMND